MNKAKKDKRNYFIFGVISVVSFFMVFTFASVYQGLTEEDKRSEIAIFLMEVKEEELSEYLRENGDDVIYLASSTSDDYLDFESDLIELIKENKLVNDFVFLDTDQIENDEFYKSFSNEYGFSNVEIMTPNLIVFENHEIKDILNFGESQINIEDVRLFLVINEVILSND